MDITNYIPVGNRNAVTRKYLATVTGFSDRKVRREIEKANAKGETAIINLQDGNGYFIPDQNDVADCIALDVFVKTEETRILSNQRKLKGPRAMRARIRCLTTKSELPEH